MRHPATENTRKSAKRQGFTLPLGTQPLARGAFAPLMYRLGQARVTGVLEVFCPGGTAPGVASAGTAGGAMVSLRIHRGVLITEGAGQDHRQAARHLALLASMGGVRYRFRAGAVPGLPGRIDDGAPLTHLATWARTHIEAQLDTARARRMVEELAGARLAVVRRHAPDPALCDAIDRRILAAMQPPRRLHEIWPLSRTSRFRLLAFLHFLRAVGALRVLDRPAEAPGDTASGAVPSGDGGDGALAGPAATEDAWRRLGVSQSADARALRRAYHRRARALHPDLQPEASEARKRRLEHELAALTDAYDHTRNRLT